ncbi:MAG: hypothetical protein ACYTXC_09990 [Nostoc sp.]
MRFRFKLPQVQDGHPWILGLVALDVLPDIPYPLTGLRFLLIKVFLISLRWQITALNRDYSRLLAISE